MEKTTHGQPKIAGYNVDALNISRGLKTLKECGYESCETEMVIEYALQRHARGEEEAAQKGAIAEEFHGVNLTSWYRILASAMRGVTPSKEQTKADWEDAR